MGRFGNGGVLGKGPLRLSVTLSGYNFMAQGTTPCYEIRFDSPTHAVSVVVMHARSAQNVQ